MRTTLLAVVLVVYFVCLALLSAAVPSPNWTTAGFVSRVIDGDTVEVTITRTLRIRLIDCWAPESKLDPRVPLEQQDDEKKAGQKSKENLCKLSLGKNVVVQIPTDPAGDIEKSMTLGRVLGRVWVPGEEKSVNELQVEQGHASKTKRWK